MGTLGGHILPGSFFIIFGLWWSFVTSIRYVQSKMKSPYKNSLNEYKASVSMPCICCPCYGLRRAPIESILKIIFTTIGILGEVITGIRPLDIPKYPVTSTMSPSTSHQHHHSRDILNSTLEQTEMIHSWWFLPGNGMHVTMYTGFLLGSIVEILIYKGYEIPAKLDWLMGGLAFGSEAYLFAFHLHGKNDLEIHLHVLLVYVIIGCIGCGLFEMIYLNQPLFTYGRILCTILQGTWFYQIGFVLYPPTDAPEWQWNPNEHNQIMVITSSFVWHIFIIMTFLLIEIWIIKRFYLSSRGCSNRFDEMLVDDDKLMVISSNNDGSETTKFLQLISDEDSTDEKIEFNSLNMKTKFKNSSSSSGHSSGISNLNKTLV